MELTILIPCLNEENTIEKCVTEALDFLKESQVDGEVLVVDNGSVDASGELAVKAGARVVRETGKGYGMALRRGLETAKGRYVIMGDGDGSCDFTRLSPLLERLRDGCDLVVGNRFSGGMEPGAMPFLHRYIGSPLLSGIGRLLYPCKVRDFQCGLRGCQRERMRALSLVSEGVEYADEMIIRAKQAGYRVEEVPVKLYPGEHSTGYHQKHFRDGIRHIRCMLRYRPVLYAIVAFLMTIVACMALLTLVNLIPQAALQKNMERSAEYFNEHKLFENLWENHNSTMVDNYADCILTNIIYSIDSTHPFRSMIKASYYSTGMENVNVSLARLVGSGGGEAAAGLLAEDSVDYFRYWHGSMVLLRPLFVLFSIQGVRAAVFILLLALTGLLLYRLIKYGSRATAVILLIGMVAVNAGMTAFCIEYVTTWPVLMVLLLTIERWERCNASMGNASLGSASPDRLTDERYMRLFLIGGMVTCFVDFLTTETITLTVPLIMLYLLRAGKKEIRSFRKEACFIIKCALCWGISYAVMFLGKWLLSAILLGGEAFGEAWEKAALRIGGTVTSDNTNLGQILSLVTQLSGTLWRNLHALFAFPADVSNRMVYLTAAGVAAVLFAFWYLKRQSGCNKTLIGILLLLGAIPYGRYLVLRNHSYLHYFFTYRAQLATVMAVTGVLWVSVLKKNEHKSKNMFKNKISRKEVRK